MRWVVPGKMSAIEDTRPYPENKKDWPTFVRAMHFLSGFLTIVVGLIFVGTEFSQLPACQGDGCIGRSLRWGTGGFTINGDTNADWRSIFSLRPSVLVETWTPVFFGILSVTAHFPGFEHRFITKSWFHAGAWNCFLALFGHLGYGGNIGIIFGTFAAIVGIMCIFMQFSPWRHERPQLHMTLGHVLDRWSFMADNEVVLTLARSVSLGIGIATLILGLVFVLTSNFNWCPATVGAVTYTECFGRSLRWNNGGPGQDFVADANRGIPGLTANGWRSIFTFNPEFFFPLWGPVILGYLTCIQHLKGRCWGFYNSWPRVFLFFLFLALFANMGYTGSFGVLVGFFSVFEAFLALLISVAGGTNTRTHFEIHVKFLDSDK